MNTKSEREGEMKSCGGYLKPYVRLVFLFATSVFAVSVAAQPAPPRAAPIPVAKPATPAPAARPATPNQNTVTALVRGTLIALDQANKTGNYSVFREMAGPVFQQQNSAARLAVMFTNMRQSGVDLSHVAVTELKFSPLPAIGPDGMLAVSGSLPVANSSLSFQMRYRKIGAYWRLAGLSVTPAKPAVPAPATAPRPTAP
jgi:hypothetical protein